MSAPNCSTDIVIVSNFWSIYRSFSQRDDVDRRPHRFTWSRLSIGTVALTLFRSFRLQRRKRSYLHHSKPVLEALGRHFFKGHSNNLMLFLPKLRSFYPTFLTIFLKAFEDYGNVCQAQVLWFKTQLHSVVTQINRPISIYP